jgi:RHS repeat-associated protein
MRSAVRSWLRRTDRYWDSLLGRATPATRPAGRSRAGRRTPPRLSLEGLEGREAPSESLASLGAPVGAGLVWSPFPDDLDARPAAAASVPPIRPADDDREERRKPRWDDLIEPVAPSRPVRQARPADSEVASRRPLGDDPAEPWLPGVGVRPSVGAGGFAALPRTPVAGPSGEATALPAGSAVGFRGSFSTTAPSSGESGAFAAVAPVTAGDTASAAAVAPLSVSEGFAAASASSTLYPSYVLDANKGAVLTEDAPNRDFAGWAVDLKAQVAGAAVQSYAWDLSGAPDATNATGLNSYRLQFTWASFTGPARTQTITLTTTFAGGGSQTQTFTFTVDGTDSPAWSAPPTSSASFPDALTEDRLVAEGAVSGTGYALGLVSGKATTSFSLPAYNPDVPALGLAYSSTAADARPIVRVRYALPENAAVPAAVTAKLTFNGVESAPVVYDTSAMNPGNVLEFALQADATNLPTGRYDYTVEVTGPSGGGGIEQGAAGSEGFDPIPPGTVVYSGRVTVVNGKDSAFGAGWSLGGLHRLWFPSDGVVIEAAGGLTRFRPTPAGGGESFGLEPVVFEGEAGDFTDFVQNQDGTYTWTLTDGTKVHFSAAGLQTGVVDRNGNTTSYGYDGNGRLTTITDEHGLVTTLTYDGAGKLASITDPAARTTGFTVTAGKLTTITDAAGEAWAYQYDAAGRLTRATDPTARDTIITYGAGGRAASAKWEDGATESLTPQAVRGLAVPPQGTETNPAPAVLAAAATAAHTDGRGYGWEYRADWSGFGRVARADVPDGGVAVTYHDGNSLPWLAADPLGRRMRSFFDGNGNPTKTVHPDDAFAQATYNDFSQPLTVTDELGRTTTYGYDAKGNPTSVTDPLNKVTVQAFNPDGTLASRTDPLNHTVTFTYDARDRLIAVTDALNHTTSYGYDGRGNKTTVTDALGHTTATLYDALNRPVTVTDARTGVTAFAYDDAGRLLSLTDPVSNTTSYTYSTQVDAVATETDPWLGVTVYAYDGEANLVSVIDRTGRVREFSYDPAGRQTGEVWRDTPGGPAVYTRAAVFDVAGQVISVSDPSSAYAYTYDLRGRVLTEDNAGTPGVPRVVFTYGYDAAGNLTSLADNKGGQVRYSYTARNELSGASLTVGGVLGANAAFGYDDAGRRTSMTRQEGTGGPTVSTTYGYDNADRLTSITHTSSAAGGLSAFTYGYDTADRLTNYTGPDGSLTYGYDDTNQLTGVSGAYSETFGYDLNGNRTGGGYSTGAGNRLLSDGTYTYTYDAEGNRLTKTRLSDGEVTSYTYDHHNRLTGVEVRTAGGILLKEERYTYDALGRRIGVLTDPDGAGPQAATRLWTAYRGDNAWADFDGSGALQTRYLFGLDMDSLIARTSAGGAVGWYLTDNLGSVRQMVTTGGAVLYAASYSAFGQIRSSSGTGGDRFGFTGREFSGISGDWYYRARYYDPASGRFLSQDPKSFGAGDANLYRYVSNSPLANTDPLGLQINPVQTIPGSQHSTWNHIAQDSQQNPGKYIHNDIAIAGGALVIGAGLFAVEAGAVGVVTAGISRLFSRSPQVTFGRDPNQVFHTFRHIRQAGLDQRAVEAAVRQDLSRLGTIPPGLTQRTITVNGTSITYNAYRLPDGTVNIGRITVP